jgi:CBS domain containing-hemolysin-like protein
MLIALAVFLLLLNAFFVAVEFALVKVRPSRLEVLVGEGRRFALTAQWMSDHLDAALGACQLGITIASLGLGWVGEPAVAAMMAPVFSAMGVVSEKVIHGVSVAVGFSVITALHLVIGELAPKAIAIRRSEETALALSLPLRWFYLAFYPVLFVLNGVALWLVRQMGIDSSGSHHGDHSEAELRALLSDAQLAGEVSRSELELLHAVFEFDDLNCRQVMVPRGDIDFIRLDAPYAEWIEMVQRTKHSRYPLCDRSLDNTIGIVHVKDLVACEATDASALRELMRPPHYVPDTLPVSRLLRYFQSVRQHLVLVCDEFGTVIGMVTLENVLERIVGHVEDEFDFETPEIVPAERGTFLVDGRILLETVNRALDLSLASGEASVSTLSGLLAERLGRVVKVGDVIEFSAARVEVLDVRGGRARQVRVTVIGTDAVPAKPDEAAGGEEFGVK